MKKQSTKTRSKAAKTADPDLVPLTQIDKENKAPAPKAGKKAKGKAEPKTKALTCLEAAAAVLKGSGEPMRCVDLIAAMKDKGLWSSSAPTPHATLYSAILREINTKSGGARFKKTDRRHFTLNG